MSRRTEMRHSRVETKQEAVRLVIKDRTNIDRNGWKIIEDSLDRAKKAGYLKNISSPITPRSLQHCFVRMAYWATDGLKLAQQLARHDSMVTTAHYTHLIVPYGPGPKTRFSGA